MVFVIIVDFVVVVVVLTTDGFEENCVKYKRFSQLLSLIHFIKLNPSSCSAHFSTIIPPLLILVISMFSPKLNICKGIDSIAQDMRVYENVYVCLGMFVYVCVFSIKGKRWQQGPIVKQAGLCSPMACSFPLLLNISLAYLCHTTRGFPQFPNHSLTHTPPLSHHSFVGLFVGWFSFGVRDVLRSSLVGHGQGIHVLS